MTTFYNDYSDYSDYSDYNNYSDYGDYSDYNNFSDYNDYTLQWLQLLITNPAALRAEHSSTQSTVVFSC